MPNHLSRRSFLALSAMLPYAFSQASDKKLPVGLELYSVREELKKDPEGTVRAVGEMGYQCVEFYAPYFERTDAQNKDMRKLLDNLGVRCFSTHNDLEYLNPDKIERTRDLNLTLGSKYVIVASADPKPGPDGWLPVADALNAAAEKLEPSGLKVGYHNHEPEFRTVNGKRPAEFLAQHTKPSVVLQLDIGTCIASGGDPVAWIRSQPGRIKSMHCKDWSPDKGYKVLFGEGVADWKNIFAAAESNGLEYYLLEQEGSRYSEIETAQRCLQTFRSTNV
ncbi:MAG TPA: sugar phosphate isomerase/epimerase [Terriglobales bacterium]|nr:sugar phosphate isomerase/epimerase [Terriglobales bacterium]